MTVCKMSCPSCSQRFEVNNEGIGSMVECPYCKKYVIVQTNDKVIVPRLKIVRDNNDSFQVVSKKSRKIYIVLAVFFGRLGIHNFYAGYTKKGIIQLAIGMLSTVLLITPLGGLGKIAVIVWNIVEMCNVHFDSDGNLMK